MIKKKIATLFALLLLPFAVWLSFFIHTSAFIHTQGWLHTIERATTHMIFNFTWLRIRPYYIAMAIVCALLALMWLKSSGKWRKVFYGLAIFLALAMNDLSLVYYHFTH